MTPLKETFDILDGAAVAVTHHDPIARRSLTLVVVYEDIHGNILDVPIPVQVHSVALEDTLDQMPSRMSFQAGTLCSAAADAILREFKSRLRVDRELRRWLIAEVSCMTMPRPPLPLSSFSFPFEHVFDFVPED